MSVIVCACVYPSLSISIFLRVRMYSVKNLCSVVPGYKRVQQGNNRKVKKIMAEFVG